MLGPACRRWRSRSSVARLRPIAIEPAVRGLRPRRALRRFFHGDDAEPTELGALAASQSGSDLVEYRRDDQFSISLPQMRVAGGEF
jgi:hypothetical protein